MIPWICVFMHRLSRRGNVPNVLGLTAMSVTRSRHACELPFLCNGHAVDVLLVDHSSSCLKDRDLRPVSKAQGLAGSNITQRSFLCHSGANTCLRYRPLVVATDWRAPGGKVCRTDVGMWPAWWLGHSCRSDTR